MRLNIGSGQRRFDEKHGWVNIDIQYKPPDQIPDVRARGEELPFPDGSAEMVVLHHVLEHYGCGESTGLLMECRRVLKMEGSLLVFVPDLRRLAHRWLTREIDDFTFMVNCYGAYQGNEADRHRWGFTASTLEKAMTPHFGIVKNFDWREIPGADIAKDWWITGVECIK